MEDTLTTALRILARDIVSEDGVATTVILQAAGEIERLQTKEAVTMSETNERSVASTGSVLRGRAALLLECQEHIAVGTHGRMNIHSLADELNEAAAVIESLYAQLSSLRKTAATLMEIAASGADPKNRRRLLDAMEAESFAEDG